MYLRGLKSGEIVQNKFLSLAVAKVKIFFCVRLPLLSPPFGHFIESFTLR